MSTPVNLKHILTSLRLFDGFAVKYYAQCKTLKRNIFSFSTKHLIFFQTSAIFSFVPLYFVTQAFTIVKTMLHFITLLSLNKALTYLTLASFSAAMSLTLHNCRSTSLCIGSLVIASALLPSLHFLDGCRRQPFRSVSKALI